MTDRPGVSYGKKPRADGRWQGYVVLTGKKRRTVIRPTEAAMRAEVDRIADQRDQGREPGTTDPTVTAYLTRWIEQRRDGVIGRRKLAPSSVVRYERLARLQIAPHIGTIRLSRLRAGHLDGLMDALRLAGESGNARQQVYRLLNVALKHAERRGLIERNPCGLLDSPQREPVRERVLDTDAITAILHAARGHPQEAMLWVAMATGVRQGELLSMRWEWIDFEDGTIRIKQKVIHLPGLGAVEDEPKTAAGKRTMSIPAAAVAALRAHREAQERAGRPNPKGLVFPSRTGTHLQPRNWTRDVWEPWKREAGIDPATPFRALTRKAHMSLMVSLNVDRETLRHRAGHTSATTTETYYVQTVAEADVEAAKKLDAELRRLASAPPKGKQPPAKRERRSG